MTTQTSEIQEFIDFLGQQLQNGGTSLTPEEAVKEFRSYQDELERCKKELEPSLERAARGEYKKIDFDELKSNARKRLAQEGIEE